jgi:ribosomal protein RSM22 (predicted rRNA methylase)
VAFYTCLSMPHPLVTAPRLRDAIEQIAARVPARELSRAADALSAAYRSTPDRPHVNLAMLGDAPRLAYLVTRFPSTLAALGAAIEASRPHVDAADVRTAVELGAGPGPSVWALPAVFPGLERIRLVDGDHRMLAVARELATLGGAPDGVAIETLTADLRGCPVEPADLVILSYALGELAEDDRAALLRRTWEAAGVALVLVEPGTSAGFARVRDARAELLSLGARVLAPCPHEGPCGMRSPDWCHFAARADRSRLHRQLKHATLGYEDEKFSYLVAGRRVRGTAPIPASRVVDRPRQRPGLVELTVCNRDGSIASSVVSRRQGPRYRAARDASWGDGWDG